MCTGLPVRRARRAGRRGVYPRVYGATGRCHPTALKTSGLSPCVRGYLSNLHLLERTQGSIPVCTGLPATTKTLTDLVGVYPRVYGATWDWPPPPPAPKGLSPCVRGYLGLAAPTACAKGSIPVCTGLPLLQSVTVPAWKEHFLSFYPFSASLCRKGGCAAARYVLAHHYLK